MKATSISNEDHTAYTVSMVDAQEFSKYPPTSLLQSYEWGQFKQQFGWHPYFFVVTQHHRNGHNNRVGNNNDDDDVPNTEQPKQSATIDTVQQQQQLKQQQQQHIPLLVLTRAVCRAFRIGYCAYAPLTALGTRTHQEYADMIHTISKQITNLITPTLSLVRWDTLAPYSAKDGILCAVQASNIPIKKSPHDIQPASTTIIDITKDATQLLESMKAKTRYNIRLSAKKGVVVHIAPAHHNKLLKWYALYRQTAQRDRIAIHSFDYYNTLSKTLNAKPHNAKLELLYAEYNREMIGGILVCYIGRQATYLYGASSNNHRNKMGNYLLQWHAIQRAQQIGCETYDLFGIPPQRNQSHAMGGLYRFKVGFNGDIIERVGCIDWIHKPLAAGICRATEKAYFWLHALKKRFK